MTKARDIASAAPAPSTVSATELGYVYGVTSAIQTQLDAKTAKSTLTTTGDIFYASGANTPARLGIGSTGNVLTVAGGIPSWAAPAGGGMTLLSTTTLSSATTTIAVEGGYIDLVIYFTGVYLPSASQGLTIRYNSVNSGYNSAFIYQASGAATLENRNNQGEIGTEGTAISDADNQYMFGYVRFFDYLGTAGMKTYQGQIVGRNDSEVYFARTLFGANSATPAAITGITFGTGAASFSAGTVKVYGVK
jgi:hypothetical protein